jgi:hypothetical protein
MIVAAKGSGTFQGQNIGGLFDDAEELPLTMFALANGAAVFLGREEAASPAFGHFAGRGDKGFGERQGSLRSALDQPDGDSLGALGTNPGELLELGDEAPHRIRVVDRGHEKRVYAREQCFGREWWKVELRISR